VPELRYRPFDRGTHVEVVVDEKPVSGLTLFDMSMQIGDVPVRCGGIGGGYTRRDYRMQGHSRRVLEESVALMQREGYHLSVLFGIENYYTKFGFVSAMADSQMRIEARDAADACLPDGDYAVRPFTAEDIPEVLAIYRAMSAGRSGAVVRDPAGWRRFNVGVDWSDRIGEKVLLRGGRVVGYFVHQLDARDVTIAEIGYADPSVFRLLLAEGGHMALEGRRGKVIYHLPADDPFAEYCRRWGCEMRITYPRRSVGMARIIDQIGLLGLLEPLFVRRLAVAGLAGCCGSLVCATDLGTDRVTLSAGGRQVCIEMPQTLLTQLVLGYRRVGDALFESDARVRDEDLPVLEALFPAGYPYMYWSDRI